MNRRAWMFTLTALLVPATAAAQDARAWQAGVAKVAITPKLPMWMSGYADRDKPAAEKVHDLWAKALVLQDAQGRRCVLVTLDLVGIAFGGFTGGGAERIGESHHHRDWCIREWFDTHDV